MGTGEGWDVGAGVGWGVGDGVGWGVGCGDSVGIGVGNGVGIGVGCGDVGRELGTRVGDTIGLQVYTSGRVSQHGVPRSLPVVT